MMFLALLIGIICMSVFSPLPVLGPLLAGLIAGLIAGGGGGRGALAGFLSGMFTSIVLIVLILSGSGFTRVLLDPILDIFPISGPIFLYTEGIVILIIFLLGLVYKGILGAIGGVIGGAIRGKKPEVQPVSTYTPERDTGSSWEVRSLTREVDSLRQEVRDLKTRQRESQPPPPPPEPPPAQSNFTSAEGESHRGESTRERKEPGDQQVST